MQNNVNNIALFTDFQNHLLNIDAESCYRLFSENPNILHLETPEEYEDKGISVNEDELPYPVQATKIVSVLNYTKNGQLFPVELASPSEKKQIAQGNIITQSVKHKVDMTMYDISQTDCIGEQFDQLLKTRNPALTDSELYNNISTLAMQCGISVHTIDFAVIDITGYYEPESNLIAINNSMDERKKLDCIINCYAEGLVENTSTKAPEYKDIDALLLSVSIKQYYELPYKYDLQRLEKNIEKVASFIDIKSIYSRNHKMMSMVVNNTPHQSQAQQPVIHSKQEITNSFLNEL